MVLTMRRWTQKGKCSPSAAIRSAGIKSVSTILLPKKEPKILPKSMEAFRFKLGVDCPRRFRLMTDCVFRKSSNNGKNGNYISEDDFEFPKLIPIRAQTAPPRPLTEIEEFRRSSDFLLLENTVMMSDQLKQRPDEKYDLDSEDGQRACKRFLNQIERLCENFKANCAPRNYREQFSKAYKVLYKEGSLCYLTEILDSAQEGFPYLWVNGEKYVFSHEVLDHGRKLFKQF